MSDYEKSGECAPEPMGGGGRAGNWWRRQSVGVKVALVLGAIVLGGGALFGLFLLIGNVTMWLWNWLMPEIFKLPAIDFWQAWGLLALSWIIFGRKGSAGEAGKSAKRKKKIKASMREGAEDD